MPFFALLVIYGLWRVWQKRQFWWLPVISVCLSFALQSHYLGLLLIPTIGVFWLLTLRELWLEKTKINLFLLFTFYFLLLFFLLTVLPLVWFDLRHNFFNYHSFYKFFNDRQTTVNFKAYKALPNLWPLWEMMVTRLLVAREVVWGTLTAIGLALGTGFLLWRRRNKALLLIFVWLVVGLVGLGLYKQHIYDHYFRFIFPVPFLLAGLVLNWFWEQDKKGKIFSIVCCLLFVLFNFKNSSLRDSPNYQLKKVQEVDRKIIAEVSSPFRNVRFSPK